MANPTKLETYTMTMTATLPFNIDIRMLAKFAQLDVNNVVCIKYKSTLRCLPIYHKLKNKNKNKSKSKTTFYNQCTLVIRIRDNKIIETKFFNNGYIHMTGCKFHIDGYKTLHRILHILTEQKIYGVVHVHTGQKKLMLAKYVDDEALNKITHVCDLFDAIQNIMPDDICAVVYSYIPRGFQLEPILINTGYNTNILINLKAFHKILRTKHKLNSSYDPLVYVAINLKIKSVLAKSESTVLIFRTGRIIISNKNYEQITKTYDFINNLISQYLEQIQRTHIGGTQTTNIKKVIYSRKNNIFLYVIKRINRKIAKNVYKGFS